MPNQPNIPCIAGTHDDTGPITLWECECAECHSIRVDSLQIEGLDR